VAGRKTDPASFQGLCRSAGTAKHMTLNGTFVAVFCHTCLLAELLLRINVRAFAALLPDCKHRQRQ